MKDNRDSLEQYVNIDGVDVCYRCDIKNDAQGLLFFIHGLGCTKECFAPVFDNPLFKRYSILTVDLPGCGESSKPESFSYTMEALASVCETLLAEFQSDKLHIVAHSMGNAVGLLLSDSIFDNVESYTVAEGNLIAEDCGLFSRGIADVHFDRYAAKTFPKQLIRFKKSNIMDFEQTAPYVIHRNAKSLVKWSDSGDLLKRFLKLDCRTCYIYGEENSDLPIFEYLPDTEKIMISNSGHGMMLDNPEEFYQKLRAFLSN